MRDKAKLGPKSSAAAVGPEERLGSAPLRAADVHIKAMGLGVVLGIAQVPFPDQRGEVAGIVQSPRQRRLGMRQVMQRVCLNQFAIGWPFDRSLRPDCHVQPRGMLARKQRGSARRADGHRISMGKAHSLLREPVQVRRFV